ncbi:adhesion domain-containing protein [Atlantibacter sp.]|uniref:adhesion domain-containing protein n=1 Tax=Atlantibacter sp. TaxID=1903473 RepID=UPI0028AD6FC9|nr:DUF823 domain-containing adhesin [Atlantibacter sp.]
MFRYSTLKKSLHFLLLAFMACPMLFSAQALSGEEAWQQIRAETGTIDGTRPSADGAILPLYQGSIQLDPAKSYAVPYTAKPGNFTSDAAANHLIVVNPQDTEGDLFSAPPKVQWQDQQVPATTVVWADAASPDIPLDPQPVNNQTFCAQNLAGRHLVAWSQPDAISSIPSLFLFTLTGSPMSGLLELQEKKVAIDVDAAIGDPLTVSASNFDSTLNAAKAKAGETITLTINTKDCAGQPLGNAAFTIIRSDALNRQGAVNNAAPVHVGNMELTTPDTVFRGVTDENGTATVTVSQDNGPGVKTTLKVAPESGPAQGDNIDVIFTTLTSPDSAKAAMWGHMAESTTVEGYTFTRPRLAAEIDGAKSTVTDVNEIWARFDWSGADAHCKQQLPDIRQLSALALAQMGSTIQDTLGWPLGDNDYWSGSEGGEGLHMAVDMRNRDVHSGSDAGNMLVSCVDKLAPDVTPKITLTMDKFNDELNAGVAQTDDSIVMKVTITDSETGEKLPYYYFTLASGQSYNRQNETSNDWQNTPVLMSGTLLKQKEAGYYQGVTNANGEATVTLTQPNGPGVRTTITAQLRNGNTSTDAKDVIFTVGTSPDSDKARMWGHMKGGVMAGNQLLTRPLLADETSKETGSVFENNEEWATYNTLSAGANQCGQGQVPSVAILDSLYQANPDNQMMSTQGWPTGKNRYLAIDGNDMDAQGVNLATGISQTFIPPTPSYLTCTATGLVTQLQVLTGDDPTLRKAKAKVGETITLTVKTVNAFNGKPVPNTPFTVTPAHGINRQGLTEYTDYTQGDLIINGQHLSLLNSSSKTYQGITDSDGVAQLEISQPTGVGIDTPLTIALVNSTIANTIKYDVIFTVLTSPDSDKANMWGHMSETLTANGNVFERPKLKSEATSATTYIMENNELWTQPTRASVNNPDAGGCAIDHLPRIEQLLSLYNAYGRNVIHSIEGWPTSGYYWSSTSADPSGNYWYSQSLADGGQLQVPSYAAQYVSCLKEAIPAVAHIDIEPVDSEQWSSSLQAAKVKKGETLKLKVTTKDSAGNPFPNAPVIVSRSNDFDRQGNEIFGSYGRPIDVNGMSLANSNSIANMVTGSDGTLELTVTRPNTQGSRAAIVVKLSNNSAISASLDTIFTVVTSPDSPKATWWGHMAETVTTKEGYKFNRPRLYSELSLPGQYAWQMENNEKWALFTYSQAQDSNHEGCGTSYIPEQVMLQALYNAHPYSAMALSEGWPVYTSYWSSTLDSTRIYNQSYKTMMLDDGSIYSSVPTQRNYLTCTNQERTNAGQIVLTSEQYVSALDAAKAHAGQKIMIKVQTKNAQGNSAPGTSFTITRGAGKSRDNVEYHSVLNMGYAGGELQAIDSGEKFFGVTDANGQAYIEIEQGNSVGLKTPLTAALSDDKTIAQAMPVIFTALSSPDTPKARFWGHMTETITTADGLTFHRPLLAAEVSNSTAMFNYRNESWASLTAQEAKMLTIQGCTAAYQPVMSELLKLYQEHSGGQLENNDGWPVRSGRSNGNWWASDRAPGNGFNQYINLSLGLVTATNSVVREGLICLSSPHINAN